jgi:hypothetical protein
VTSFTVATAANDTNSERLQGDTASNSDAAPQHKIQFIDYIEYCQCKTIQRQDFMLRHNNKPPRWIWLSETPTRQMG